MDWFNLYPKLTSVQMLYVITFQRTERVTSFSTRCRHLLHWQSMWKQVTGSAQLTAFCLTMETSSEEVTYDLYSQWWLLHHPWSHMTTIWYFATGLHLWLVLWSHDLIYDIFANFWQKTNKPNNPQPLGKLHLLNEYVICLMASVKIVIKSFPTWFRTTYDRKSNLSCG